MEKMTLLPKKIQTISVPVCTAAISTPQISIAATVKSALSFSRSMIGLKNARPLVPVQPRKGVSGCDDAAEGWHSPMREVRTQLWDRQSLP
jgi:hypothetical protein